MKFLRAYDLQGNPVKHRDLALNADNVARIGVLCGVPKYRAYAWLRAGQMVRTATLSLSWKLEESNTLRLAREADRKRGR